MKIIGFIVTEQVADMVNASVAKAQTDRGLEVYWLPGKLLIYAGEHADSFLIPFSDEVMATVLRQGMTPMDFPETETLLAALGGMEARVEINPADLIDPNLYKT